MFAPTTNILAACLTKADFSLSGPTIMPGQSIKDKTGISKASHNCINLEPLSAPGESIAPDRCPGLLATTPTGLPSTLIKEVIMPGLQCLLISRTESSSAIPSITFLMS